MGDTDPFGYGDGGPDGSNTSSGDAQRRAGNTPLGVPKGYKPEVPNYRRYQYRDPAFLQYMQPTPGWGNQTRQFQSAVGRQKKEVGPRYFDGDQYRHRNMSPAEIWELQQIMSDAGLLTEEFSREIWDESTADAYAKVLSYANQQGLTDKQALMELAGVGGGQGLRYKVDENGNLVQVAGPGTQPQDTRAPLVTRTTDPEALRLVFKEASKNMLGVALAPAEVDRMIKSYNDMEVQRQTEAYNKELTGGSVVDIPSSESYGAADILKRHAPAAQDYQALQNVTDAMSFLASPAWGIGA